MIDETTGQPHTAHTTNPMLFMLILDDGIKHELRNDGILADLAPTALGLLKLPKSDAMT